MTPYRSSPRLRLKEAILRLTAITLGLGLSFLAQAQAQNNNPGDYAANDINTPEQCSPQDTKNAAAQSSALDWLQLEAVPESMCQRQCINCEGMYIDPLAQEITDTPTEQSDIHANADSTRLEGNEIILSGEVNAVQGNRHMRSDNVVINREQESALLQGNVTLREPNLLLHGDHAQIYSVSGETFVYDSQFVFHREHMRGTADTLHRDQEGLIHIHNGNFTYCPPGQDDWSVLSRDMEVDVAEGLATAHHARVEVEGVPVFYTPWLRLPIDDRRRTGLLWPDFGNDSSGGLDISTPIYLNLAPNYDALYAPRYIEERGLNHQLQLRYLNPLIGEWAIGGAYMANDKRYADQAPESVSTDRWLGVVKQNGLFAERWASTVDYSKASDVDYLRDLETASIDAQRSTNLLQKGSMDYLGDSWLVNMRAQQFQSLADDIREQYKILPQLTNQYRSNGTPFTLQPILLAQYSNFGADEVVVTGERLYGETGLSYPMIWSFGFLKPTVKYRQVNYELTDTTTVFTDDSPNTGAPLMNVDGGLTFERQTSFADKGILQTLEPRLYYLYSEREDQTDQPIFDTAELTFNYYQLFRDTRFSGYDRLDDANQVSVGLTSRFIDEQNGRNLLSASLGQIFYEQDREVRLGASALALDEPSSNIAGELLFTPTEKLGLSTNLTWDPHEDNLDSGFLRTSYTTDNGSIFNLGYAYRRNPLLYVIDVDTLPLTEEASVSSYLPLTNHWSVFAAMSYSVEDNISVEDMVGVEYDSCCWMVRLVQLRYYNNVSGAVPDFSNPDLERENSIQFQFVLKGMGGFGNRITNIMQDMIRGFNEREY